MYPSSNVSYSIITRCSCTIINHESYCSSPLLVSLIIRCHVRNLAQDFFCLNPANVSLTVNTFVTGWHQLQIATYCISHQEQLLHFKYFPLNFSNMGEQPNVVDISSSARQQHALQMLQDATWILHRLHLLLLCADTRRIL